MNWQEAGKEFGFHLKLEKGLSENTVKAYLSDIKKLAKFMEQQELTQADQVKLEDLRAYVLEVSQSAKERTQARVLSSIKAFYQFLMAEGLVEVNPAGLLESPKLGFYLPDVLSVEEVNAMIDSIDLSSPLGERNRAILEALYGLGLRVSELVNLKLSDIYWKEDFVQITGKGNKQRLVPLAKITAKYLDIYIHHVRTLAPQKAGASDYVFLNRRGAKMSRVMVFYVVKEAVKNAGIDKTVSPHSLRHSFATHLVTNGADLISVQKMLGHESITTTEIYTHLDRRFLRDTLMKYHPKA